MVLRDLPHKLLTQHVSQKSSTDFLARTTETMISSPPKTPKISATSPDTSSGSANTVLQKPALLSDDCGRLELAMPTVTQTVRPQRVEQDRVRHFGSPGPSSSSSTSSSEDSMHASDDEEMLELEIEREERKAHVADLKLRLRRKQKSASNSSGHSEPSSSRSRSDRGSSQRSSRPERYDLTPRQNAPQVFHSTHRRKQRDTGTEMVPSRASSSGLQRDTAAPIALSHIAIEEHNASQCAVQGASASAQGIQKLTSQHELFTEKRSSGDGPDRPQALPGEAVHVSQHNLQQNTQNVLQYQQVHHHHANPELLAAARAHAEATRSEARAVVSAIHAQAETVVQQSRVAAESAVQRSRVEAESAVQQTRVEAQQRVQEVEAQAAQHQQHVELQAQSAVNTARSQYTARVQQAESQLAQLQATLVAERQQAAVHHQELLAQLQAQQAQMQAQHAQVQALQLQLQTAPAPTQPEAPPPEQSPLPSAPRAKVPPLNLSTTAPQRSCSQLPVPPDAQLLCSLCVRPASHFCLVCAGKFCDECRHSCNNSQETKQQKSPSPSRVARGNPALQQPGVPDDEPGDSNPGEDNKQPKKEKKEKKRKPKKKREKERRKASRSPDGGGDGGGDDASSSSDSDKSDDSDNTRWRKRLKRRRRARPFTVGYYPKPSQFETWKQTIIQLCEAATRDGDSAYQWICATMEADVTFEQFSDTEGFRDLDAQLAGCIRPILRGDILRQVTLKTKQVQKDLGHNIRGRQILWLILNDFETSRSHVYWDDIEDLLILKCTGDDNLKAFQRLWDETVDGLKTDVPVETLQHLYFKQVKNCKCLASLVEKYEDAADDDECRTYAHLRKTVLLKLERRQHAYVREEKQKSLGGKVASALAATQGEGAQAQDVDEHGLETGAATKPKEDKPPKHQPALAATDRERLSPAVWNKVCNAFAEGKCMAFQKPAGCSRANCGYTHEVASDKDEGNPAPPKSANIAKAKAKTKGRGKGGASRDGPPSPRAARNPNQQCPFQHKTGGCKFGDQCDMKHT